MPTPDFILSLRERIGHELLLVPTVAVLARDVDGRLLLVQDAESGRWSCPGGIVEPGQLPADAAVREAWEESGVRVELVRVAGVFGGAACSATYLNGDRLAYVATVFEARAIAGAPRGDGSETLDARFFTADEIAALPLKGSTRMFIDADSGDHGGVFFQPATWTPD